MKRLLTLANLRLGVEVLLIVVLLPLAFSQGDATRAAAPQAPEAPDATDWYVCNAPYRVGLFNSRVHIFCGSTTPVGGAPALSTSIHYFAVPTVPDSATASRYMSMLQTSVITSKTILLYVNPEDTSGASFGCGSGDCRRLYGIEMR